MRKRNQWAHTLLALSLATLMTLPSQAASRADSMIKLPERLAGADTVHASQAAPWAVLGDPVLPGLIERALLANTDIRQAAASLRMAKHAQHASAKNNWPQAPVRITHHDGDVVSEPWSAGLALSWEADLLGRLSNQRARARAQYAAVEADEQHLRLMVAAEVARTWFQLRGARAAEAAHARYSAAQKDLVRLTALLVSEGQAAPDDLARSEAEAASDAAEEQIARDRVFVLQARLAVLLGEVPGAWQAPASPELSPLRPLSLGVPHLTDWLGARADVQAAASRLRASEHEIRAAAAARFPRFNVLGVLSFLAGDFDALFSRQRDHGADAVLSWNPLDLPRLQADYRTSEAASELALAAYDQALLRALEDAETSLHRHHAANQRLALRLRAAHHASEALAATQLRYEAGAAPYLQILLARRDRIRAELAGIDALVEQRTATVDVLRALGSPPASSEPHS